MDEASFWGLIDNANKDGENPGGLEGFLLELDLEEIVMFKNHLNVMLVKAYTVPMLEACFIILSYVSDDVFDDFLSWLVLSGRERFFNAIRDPESIATWLRKDAVDQIHESEMVLLPLCVYEAKGGDEDEFYEKVVFQKKPEIHVVWPDNKKDYFQKYPELTRVFWNQEAIDGIHE